MDREPGHNHEYDEAAKRVTKAVFARYKRRRRIQRACVAAAAGGALIIAAAVLTLLPGKTPSHPKDSKPIMAKSSAPALPAPKAPSPPPDIKPVPARPSVSAPAPSPRLTAAPVRGEAVTLAKKDGHIALNWPGRKNGEYVVYRCTSPRFDTCSIAEVVKGNQWVDREPLPAPVVFYRVVRKG